MISIAFIPLVQAPPNVVSTEDRRASEAVFMDFRKTRGPFALCRQESIIRYQTGDRIRRLFGLTFFGFFGTRAEGLGMKL